MALFFLGLIPGFLLGASAAFSVIERPAAQVGFALAWRRHVATALAIASSSKESR